MRVWGLNREPDVGLNYAKFPDMAPAYKCTDVLPICVKSFFSSLDKTVAIALYLFLKDAP